ncbi:hypothetical protein Y032_0045g1132 [Ancylostoma ceylanicum]|uniref:palmitoyl-protein hydrolase n=2 Tax=Ancylostoma ceylanicum TaxID=53326 RepID=A0A016UDD3_9BILA|nr:hypothetical protein Y032_0045g1132 [Ancylostoma ceylanicum]
MWTRSVAPLSRLLLSGLSASFAIQPQACAKPTLFTSLLAKTLHQSAMSQAPPPVVINAKKNHTSTVIFLHGLGDQGDGWSDVFAHEVRHDNTKYICPSRNHSSASRPVTLNMGMRMPAWFDLYGLDASSREDDEGIAQATRLVHGMIDAEIATGIPSEKIILGGFSMGGALALYAGLTYPHKLGGIVGLSSFLIQRDKLPGVGKRFNWQEPVGSNFLASLYLFYFILFYFIQCT